MRTTEGTAERIVTLPGPPPTTTAGAGESTGADRAFKPEAHAVALLDAGTPLEVACRAFIMARQASRCTTKTVEHYRYTVGSFIRWLTGLEVVGVRQITATHIRQYLIALQDRKLKDTSQHAHARGIRAWLNWLVQEGDLGASPMWRVAMPRLEQRLLPAFTTDEVRRLLAACNCQTERGARDYAIILSLLDTGLRAAELISLRVGGVDMRSGLATVLGKGRKQRTIRVGLRARSAIRRMLAFRSHLDDDSPLWMARDIRGRVGALSLHGLQTMLHRLGTRAGVLPCGPHRFRRTFALWMLRDGCDLHSLRTLMGHSSLTVLQRYLDLGGEDIERAHAAHSPGDKLLEKK